MTKEEAVQKVMSIRGYGVVSSWFPNRIGQVIKAGFKGYEISQPFCVVAKTTEEDFVEQYTMLRSFIELEPQRLSEGLNYYRVVTD